MEFMAGLLGVVDVASGEENQIRSPNSITGDVAFLGTSNQRGVEVAIRLFRYVGPLRVAEIVRSHAPPIHDPRPDRPSDRTFHAPYPQRTIRTFRAAMKSLQDPAEQAQKILEIIRDLGLEPYVPPNPYPRSPQTMFTSSAGSPSFRVIRLSRRGPQ